MDNQQFDLEIYAVVPYGTTFIDNQPGRGPHLEIPLNLREDIVTFHQERHPFPNEEKKAKALEKILGTRDICFPTDRPIPINRGDSIIIYARAKQSSHGVTYPDRGYSVSRIDLLRGRDVAASFFNLTQNENACRIGE